MAITKLSEANTNSVKVRQAVNYLGKLADKYANSSIWFAQNPKKESAELVAKVPVESILGEGEDKIGYKLSDSEVEIIDLLRGRAQTWDRTGLIYRATGTHNRTLELSLRENIAGAPLWAEAVKEAALDIQLIGENAVTGYRFLDAGLVGAPMKAALYEGPRQILLITPVPISDFELTKLYGEVLEELLHDLAKKI